MSCVSWLASGKRLKPKDTHDKRPFIGTGMKREGQNGSSNVAV
jgi:hypothetical protein